MEGEAGMAGEPGPDLRMLVGGVVVEDGMDELAGRHLGFDGIEKADEFLMPVALHAAADHLAVEDVESGEEGGGAVALIVVGHGAGTPLLDRQARLGAVESLDLALLVDREHDGMGGRIDIEPDDLAQLVGEGLGSLESLKGRMRCGARPWARGCVVPSCRLMPAALAMATAGPMGCFSWRGQAPDILRAALY